MLFLFFFERRSSTYSRLTNSTYFTRTIRQEYSFNSTVIIVDLISGDAMRCDVMRCAWWTCVCLHPLTVLFCVCQVMSLISSTTSTIRTTQLSTCTIILYCRLPTCTVSLKHKETAGNLQYARQKLGIPNTIVQYRSRSVSAYK